MDEKIKIVSVTIIFLCILILFGHMVFNNTETVQIGSTTISIPTGYTVDKNEGSSLTLKKNNINIAVEESDLSTDTLIENYKNKHQNQLINVEDVQIKNTSVKSLSLKDNDGNEIKKLLYVEKDGKTYTVIFKKYDENAIQTIIGSLNS